MTRRVAPRRRLARTVAATVLVLGAMATAAAAQPAPDPEAAERQFRLARRLVAEGSAEAGPALRRVLELDPRGSLADDALVELALLAGAPRWPEDLGRIDASAADRARELLTRVGREFPDTDRALEARLLHALLWLEPLPRRDPSAARLELLAVAALQYDSEWGPPARYAIGWLDERQGETRRARDAYQRLVIDVPASAAAHRARVGLARLDLREGRYAAAARWLQEAIDGGVSEQTGAPALRALAIRSILRSRDAGGRWERAETRRTSTTARGGGIVCRLPDGGVLVGDRRRGIVERFDAGGRAAGQWTLDDLQALAVDGLGRGFAAAGERLYRLDRERAVAVAGLGEFAPVSALTADATGYLWLADRRGTRVGRLDPGAPAPVPIWTAEDNRATALVRDGRRLVAIDGRSGRVFEIDDTGVERALASGSGLQRPAALAADPAGRLVALDGKSGMVVLLEPEGTVLERYSLADQGVSRPTGLAVGADGSLDVLDGSTGAWVRIQ